MRHRPSPLAILVQATLLLAVPIAALPLADLRIAGETAPNGVYDPSVEYAQVGGEGWLAYSAVSGGEVPYGPNVATHLARSDDGGASWSFAQEVNGSSTPTRVTLANGQSVFGQWNYEVASLAYDPGDADAPWKMFYHRILRELKPDGSSVNVPGASWIGMRTASDPAEGWSPEIALFRGSIPLPHANAKLTPASRRLLIRRVREESWPVKRAAEAAA